MLQWLPTVVYLSWFITKTFSANYSLLELQNGNSVGKAGSIIMCSLARPSSSIWATGWTNGCSSRSTEIMFSSSKSLYQPRSHPWNLRRSFFHAEDARVVLKSTLKENGKRVWDVFVWLKECSGSGPLRTVISLRFLYDRNFMTATLIRKTVKQRYFIRQMCYVK